jgi:CDGSH-type Zn-finger protein
MLPLLPHCALRRLPLPCAPALAQAFSAASGSAPPPPPPPPQLAHSPRVVSFAPARVPVEEGRTYFWCACGHTRTEPWCDGAHKALSTIRPVKWVAPKSGTANVCACRHTKREGRVLCDGGHVHLPREGLVVAGEDAGGGGAEAKKT